MALVGFPQLPGPVFQFLAAGHQPPDLVVFHLKGMDGAVHVVGKQAPDGKAAGKKGKPDAEEPVDAIRRNQQKSCNQTQDQSGDGEMLQRFGRSRDRSVRCAPTRADIRTDVSFGFQVTVI